MKTAFLILVILSLPIDSFAQQQNGYVKTRGRLADDGSVIAGTRLSGATVVLKGGNSTVSDSQGDFTLSVSGKYYLQNIKKQGYIVSDPDILSKSYSYSANDLVLVLDTPTQQADDRLANERKIRRTLQRQLQQREDEIEDLKAQNKITQEEYRQALQKLYSDQENNEKLISDMAERYSRIDYDQIDEFNRLFSSYILNGELTKADSLLRTKGDLKSDIESYRRLQSANKQERDELARRQENLEKSEAYEWFKLNDLAQFCEQKAELFKMQYQNDSVAYYYETRASLDTTNVDWQIDAGRFLRVYKADYPRAMFFFELALRQSRLQYGEISEKTATNYINIGSIYSDKSEYAKALEYYEKSLVIQLMVDKTSPAVATSYNNIGMVYYHRGEYVKALEHYEKSLQIWMGILGEIHHYVAGSYNNLGMVYSVQGEYAKALEYYEKSLQIRLATLGEMHPDVAASYNNLGMVYSVQGEYAKALEYIEKSLQIRLAVFGEPHPFVATSYDNIGNVYFYQGEYVKAMEYYEKALQILLSVFGETNPDIASCYGKISSVYFCQGDYVKAMEYYEKSLQIHLLVFGEIHPVVAAGYYNIGNVYYNQSEYAKALGNYEKALQILLAVLGETHPDVAASYSNIGDVYYNQSEYAKALEYYEKSLQIRLKTLGETHIDVAMCYGDIVSVYYKQGNFDMALENCNKALDIATRIENSELTEAIERMIKKMKDKMSKQ